MPAIKDRWIRIGLPSLMILITLVNMQIITAPFSQKNLAITLYTIGCHVVSFEMSRLIILTIRRRLPFLHQTRQRLLVTFAYNFATIFPLKIVNFSIYLLAIHKLNGLKVAPVISLGMESLLVVIFSIGTYEAIYFYRRFMEAEREKDELLRANLQSQLAGLKSQVNPHFLFNSLNSLSALISKDPDRAEEFVEEMSSVYRYLLKNNNHDLTTLGKELQFVKSYLHMLQTRFGEGLQLHIDIEEDLLHWLLPPLTLQMLVENAIKHNIVSVHKPLCISLSTEEGNRLFVKNNLQKKPSKLLSEKVGLSNIASKYRLLNAQTIDIEETEDEFIVIIPLIKNYEYQTADY